MGTLRKEHGQAQETADSLGPGSATLHDDPRRKGYSRLERSPGWAPEYLEFCFTQQQVRVPEPVLPVSNFLSPLLGLLAPVLAYLAG